MIVCICRDIRDSEYNNNQDLLDRLLEGDVCCGKCLEEFVDVDKIGHLGREFDSPHLHQRYTVIVTS
jgi:hypothetical protein